MVTPRDGLKERLKARFVKDGTNPSVASKQIGKSLRKNGTVLQLDWLVIYLSFVFC